MTKYFCDKCKQENIIASTVEVKHTDNDLSVGSNKPLKLELCSMCRDLFMTFLRHD